MTGDRVNKLLTMLSRRDADKAISSGRVFVNNSQACLGQTVKAGDVLVLDGKIVDWESIWNSRKIGKQSYDVYFKYWKPRGVVCTTSKADASNVVDAAGVREGSLRVVPIGRLDKQSSGLLLMTSDTRLVGALTHPASNISKTYEVTLNRIPTSSELEVLSRGVNIPSIVRRNNMTTKSFVGVTQPCVVRRTEEPSPSLLHDLYSGAVTGDIKSLVNRTISITLKEGRNRQIRLMAEALGMCVVRLHRLEFAGVSLHAGMREAQLCSLNETEMDVVIRGHLQRLSATTHK